MNMTQIRDPTVFMKKLSTYCFTLPTVTTPPTTPLVMNPGWYEIVANTHQEIKVGYLDYNHSSLWEKIKF